MPTRVHRDLSIPQPIVLLDLKDNKAVMAVNITKLDDNRIDQCTPKPKTLRHSWYKAVDHLYNDEAQVKLKLHEIRLRELRLSLIHKRDYFDVLVSYMVPLQALLDFTLDDESNFKVTTSN